MRSFALALAALAAAALTAHGQGRQPDAAALVKDLKDKDKEVRQDAAVLLGRMGPAAKDAVPALIESLKDEAVAQRAAIALAKIGPDAVPALRETLKGRDAALRAEAARVLGDIGPGAKAALPDLLAALNEANKTLRGLAVRAVGRVGPDAASATPALVKLLKDPDRDLRVLAVMALIHVGPKASVAVPALTTALKTDEDEEVRRLAAGALGEFTAEAKEPEVVRALTRALHDDSPFVRLAAAFVLGQIGPDAKTANPTLRTALQKDPDKAVRLGAALALSVTDPKNPDAVDAVAAALSDEQPFLRTLAGNVLASMGTYARAALPALQKALNDPDPEVRLAAASAIVRITPSNETAAAIVAKAVPQMVGVFQETDVPVPSHARVLTAQILGNLGPKAREAVPALKEAQKDKNERVREAATQALKQIQGE